MIEETEQIINQLKPVAAGKQVAAASLAVAHLAKGDKDGALFWLLRGVENRSGWLIMLDAEPWWDPLRSDPRFQQIRTLLGLAA